ncbi:MAG: sigma-54 factor interaction domain-containing protein [bacterium]|nr:sigma-54 factor interaction domain-containing protein [bacterium]
MGVLTAQEKRRAEALAKIGYCNPFLPERLELERQVLGKRFRSGDAVINSREGLQREQVFRNFDLLYDQACQLTEKLRGKCQPTVELNVEEQRLYRELALFVLYGRHFSLVNHPDVNRRGLYAEVCAEKWPAFFRDYQHYLGLRHLQLPEYFDAAHCFAIFFQIDRAFANIFSSIIGTSTSIARLRASIWESIFTHDMQRYVRGIYRSMGDMTTLITGESGTGKELVARAIGLSRYQPFDPRKKSFHGVGSPLLLSVNLAALAPTLIESELFGHCKGSFTGAIADRVGWLEACPAEGSVFLDEIGELDPSIQVKLLRVLQTRQFSRLGETLQREFQGKFIAATNRQLETLVHEGAFRKDLYYRLCADRIHTPSMRQQLADSPQDLQDWVHFIVGRTLRDMPEETQGVAQETMQWIDLHLGSDYDWPGNIRELEQRVRNVIIRRQGELSAYAPVSKLKSAGPGVTAAPSAAGHTAAGTRAEPVQSLVKDRSLEKLLNGSMSLAEVEQWYTDYVYRRLGRYDLTAERLAIDWRTVKDKVQKFAESARVDQ